MKKLYVMKKEFYAQHPHIASIQNMSNEISESYKYLIDPESFELFKIEVSYKKPHINAFGKEYDLLLSQIETHGSSKTKQGHRLVSIAGKKYTLARIIASTFIKNPEHHKDVMHIDRNPFNDSIANLCWCSHRDLVKSYYDENKISTSSEVKLNLHRGKNKKKLELEKEKLKEEQDDDEIIWSTAYTSEQLASIEDDESDYSE